LQAENLKTEKDLRKNIWRQIRMQKEIGAVMGLYPTPVTVVGVAAEGRVNFLTVAHVGVVEHGEFVISVDKAHEFSDAGIRKNGTVSVSLVSQSMLEAADYCGIAKGASTDKSGVFRWHFGELENAPILDDAPVCMACRVADRFMAGNFTNYILKPEHTYVQEEDLDEKGKIDYEKASPVLFEFQSAQYLGTGKVIGKCWQTGRNYRTEQ
jgi:flavin reductase (DIM6/NTAB) family NADH-FMN oxidoreductase RutF